MKVALTAKGTKWDSEMDARFGRTEYFFIYNEEGDDVSIVDNTAILNEAHGAGPKTAQRLFDEKVDVLITGNGPGGNAAAVLEKVEVEIYIGGGNMTIKEAYDAYKNGELKKL